MISTAFVLMTAAMSMQASDTTRAARESFAHCLRSYVDASTRDHKTVDQFNAAYPQACPAEQAAFRQAIIQREIGFHASRASAEESANSEVADTRSNFNDIFQMSQPAPQVAASAPPPTAAAPAQPTVPAQPAAQTTGAAHPPAQPH